MVFMSLYIKSFYNVKTLSGKLTVQESHHQVASLTQVSLACTMPTSVQRSCCCLSVMYTVLETLLIRASLMWHCAFGVLF